ILLAPLDFFNKPLRRRTVIVSHAGVGTMIDAISANVPIIVWPRLRQYGEHINDHQLELAQAMSEQGRATLVNNRDELFAALQLTKLPLPVSAAQSRATLVQTVRESLSAFRAQKEPDKL